MAHLHYSVKLCSAGGSHELSLGANKKEYNCPVFVDRKAVQVRTRGADVSGHAYGKRSTGDGGGA